MTLHSDSVILPGAAILRLYCDEDYTKLLKFVPTWDIKRQTMRDIPYVESQSAQPQFPRLHCRSQGAPPSQPSPSLFESSICLGCENLRTTLWSADQRYLQSIRYRADADDLQVAWQIG